MQWQLSAELQRWNRLQFSEDDETLQAHKNTVELKQHNSIFHIKAVSYTHLDVYKRQAPGRPPLRGVAHNQKIAGNGWLVVDAAKQYF